VKNGIGQNLISISSTLPATMKWFYAANDAYTSTTVCIKLSLLCRYLGLFLESYRRVIALVALAIIVLWSEALLFMAWVALLSKSRALGDRLSYRTTVEVKSTLLAFASSNMLLDLVVSVITLTEYFRLNLKRKQILAMTGVFTVELV
jgi:hypothetical protein